MFSLKFRYLQESLGLEEEADMLLSKNESQGIYVSKLQTDAQKFTEKNTHFSVSQSKKTLAKDFGSLPNPSSYSFQFLFYFLTRSYSIFLFVAIFCVLRMKS